MTEVYLTGTGAYIPDNIYSNEMLCRSFGVPESRGRRYGELLGVQSRPICIDALGAKNQIVTGEEMAYHAAEAALKCAGLEPAAIDTVICCTSFFDFITPPVSSRLLKRFSIAEAQTYDLVGGCAEFLHGLHLARNLVRSGEAANVLVTSSEVISAWWAQIRYPLEYFIFGDTGGAFVVSATPGPYRIRASRVRTRSNINGDPAELICMPIIGGKSPAPLFYSDSRTDPLVCSNNGGISIGAEYRLVHNGRQVAIGAPSAMILATDDILAEAGIDPREVFLVPHQASIHVLKALAATNVPASQIGSSLSTRGNMSTSSVPVTLTEHWDKAIRQPYLVLTSVGVGMSFGATLLEQTDWRAN
jgi:3-oxoacyl-[acyl-carrier-protein] synthase-3